MLHSVHASAHGGSDPLDAAGMNRDLEAIRVCNVDGRGHFLGSELRLQGIGRLGHVAAGRNDLDDVRAFLDPLLGHLRDAVTALNDTTQKMQMTAKAGDRRATAQNARARDDALVDSIAQLVDDLPARAQITQRRDARL